MGTAPVRHVGASEELGGTSAKSPSLLLRRARLAASRALISHRHRTGPRGSRCARSDRRAEAATARALAAGARVVTGGRRTPGFERGFFYEPTLLTDVTNDMHVAQEEVFGPVYAVIRYRDLDDAIRIANDTKYGLSSAVFTDDRQLARRVADRVRTGIFTINSGGAALTEPYGGFKQSGIGRESGMEGLMEHTETKAVMLNDLV